MKEILDKKVSEEENSDQEDVSASENDSNEECGSEDISDQEQGSVDVSNEEQGSEHVSDEEQGSEDVSDEEEGSENDSDQEQDDLAEDDESEKASDQEEAGSSKGFEKENGSVFDQEKFAPKKSKDTEPGLIYINKPPPGMTPHFLNKLFSKYGEVGRIYMEPDHKRNKRVKAKYDQGNFKEGWIEFGDKKLARRLAMSFNDTLITDEKQTKFKNYRWNLKYLPKFRWSHLQEGRRQENEKRKQRERVEFEQAKREVAVYMSRVESSKKLASIKQRKSDKGEQWKDAKPIKVRQRKTVKQLQAEKRKFENKSAASNSNSGGNNNDNNKPPRKKFKLSMVFG